MKASKIGQGSEEEVDLERDENAESLMKRSELDPKNKQESDPNSTIGERNKKFLLNEDSLKGAIKDECIHFDHKLTTHFSSEVIH